MTQNAGTSLFVFFISTIFLIVAAYYTTRFIGKKTAAFTQKKQVSLLEKTLLPGNMSVQAVRFAEHVYVIMVHSKGVTKLDRMTLEEWKAVRQQVSGYENMVHNNNGLMEGLHSLIQGFRKQSNEGYDSQNQKGD